MPALAMYLSDIFIVRQYLDEIDAISEKYDSNREKVIALADKMGRIKSQKE